MKLEALEPDAISSDEWARRVDALDGNPLHLPAVHLADLSRRDLRFLVFDNGVALGPGFDQKGGRNWRGRRERILHLPTPPASRDAEARANSCACTLEYCVNAGYDRLSIGHTWGESFQDIDPFRGHVTSTVFEFVLDLEQGPDAVLAGMHKNHRKNIRRAERQGLTVRPDNSLKGLLELRRLQLVSSGRARDRGEGFAVRDPEYFERVHREVYGSGIGHVFFADLEGECVGAMAYLSTGKKGITVRSGCTAEGYKTYAMYLLQNEVIKDAQDRGLSRLNIGGVPAEAENGEHSQHGLYEFKKGFGGERFTRNAVSMKTGRAS